eukprot:1181613-Prorocentrum_minimum.AAC.2
MVAAVLNCAYDGVLGFSSSTTSTKFRLQLRGTGYSAKNRFAFGELATDAEYSLSRLKERESSGLGDRHLGVGDPKREDGSGDSRRPVLGIERRIAGDCGNEKADTGGGVSGETGEDG